MFVTQKLVVSQKFVVTWKTFVTQKVCHLKKTKTATPKNVLISKNAVTIF